MRIRYALTRAEIVHGFLLGSVRSPRLLTILLLGLLWPGVIYLMTTGALSRTIGAADIERALELSFAALCFFVLWVFLRGKTTERTLNVTEGGIFTRIGSMNGEVPWRKVKTVVNAGPYILVIGSSGNAFFIPERAFSEPDEKDQFLAEISTYRSQNNG